MVTTIAWGVHLVKWRCPIDLGRTDLGFRAGSQFTNPFLGIRNPRAISITASSGRVRGSVSEERDPPSDDPHHRS